MRTLEKMVNPREIFYVLTADHGVAQIPELSHEKGLYSPRINVKKMLAALNEAIQNTHQIKELFTPYSDGQFYVDEAHFAALPAIQQAAILADAKKVILSHEGIKRVWTFEELQKATFHPGSFESYFQGQLFAGRSGKLIVQTHPYVYLEEYATGTGHITPYHNNTQVPLILYRKGFLKKRRIMQRVWMQQLAPTLAHILQISKPAAARYELLPGIIKNKSSHQLEGNKNNEYAKAMPPKHHPTTPVYHPA